MLDAYTFAFIARLIDAEKEELVPRELLECTKRVTDLPAWTKVTHGRSTASNRSYGYVGLLKDI